MAKREIKFRAWYNKDKKMCVVNKISELPTKTIWEDGSVLMQYTGHKDKNGKEIYEGDIIKTDNYKGTHLFTVEYEKEYSGALGAFVFNTKEEISSVHCEAIETGVVIGNIYENPELLEN